jgi:hypothetical protein
VNALADAWTQAHCARACDALEGCTAFVYGYEAYEAGGSVAHVPQRCTLTPPACLFSNPDAQCHVPRCYLRRVESLVCGDGSLSCSGYQGGGSVACSQKDADGALLTYGEFSVYIKE